VGRYFLLPRELTTLFLSLFRTDLRRPAAEWRGLLLVAAVLVGVDMGLSYVLYATVPATFQGEIWWANGIYAVRLVLAAGALAWLVRRGAPAAAFGLRRETLRADAAWGVRAIATGTVLYAVAACLGVAVLLAVAGRLPAPPAWLRDFLAPSALAGTLPQRINEGVSGVVMAPLAEEAVYRALLLSPLLLALRPWAAVLVDALVFAFLHAVPYGFGWFTPSELLGGALMSIAFLARRSVVPAVLVHAAANLLLALSGVLYCVAADVAPGWFA